MEVGLRTIFGVNGMHIDENSRARFWGKIFTIGIVIISIILLLQWHFEVLGQLVSTNDMLISWIIWIFFIIYITMLLTLVERKMRFLLQNWFIIFTIIFTIPIVFDIYNAPVIFKEIRPIIAFVLLIPWFLTFVIHAMSQKRLTQTLLAIFAVILLSGFVVAGVDPAIKTVWDGFWWAWVTMSTVGYGDYVPVSFIGRILASMLILLGLAMFAILTANFSSIFLKGDVKTFRKEGRALRKVSENIKNSDDVFMSEILQSLHRLEDRLDKLEIHTK